MLANKYRPRTFNELVGQHVTSKILQAQIDKKEFSNMIFIGPAGTGKTTCAKLLASGINGEILELDSASHNGVNDVKAIIQKTTYKPLTGDYRIIIFDEAHTLSPAAWSSLLITLENSESFNIFIFCTTEPDKIPFTIISRLQRFNFKPLTEEQVSYRLWNICQSENINISNQDIALIARASKGNLRQALQYLDQYLLYNGPVNEVVGVIPDINSLVDLIYSNKGEALSFFNNLLNNGYTIKMIREQLLDYCVRTMSHLELIEVCLDKEDDKNYFYGKILTMRD